MNIDEQERIDAAARYIEDESPSVVCKDLNRSVKWFFKWINRFNSGDKDWYKSKSRAPEKHGTKTNADIEQVVVNIRKTLMDGSEHE